MRYFLLGIMTVVLVLASKSKSTTSPMLCDGPRDGGMVPLMDQPTNWELWGCSAGGGCAGMQAVEAKDAGHREWFVLYDCYPSQDRAVVLQLYRRK